jgi:hypothetical protein
MIKEFWIDKIGGRHYHTKNCPMIKSIAINMATKQFIESHYEPVKRHVSKTWQNPFYIVVDGKQYIPCSCNYEANK